MGESSYISDSSWRRTKIIATLGPASSDITVIKNLIAAGVDVFRINFSHGTHKEHAALVDNIRKAESDSGSILAILGDIQGPKFRIGCFKDGRTKLQQGHSFRFDTSQHPGDELRVNLPHPELLAGCKIDDILTVDDGRFKFKVATINGDSIQCTVKNGGIISDKKGISFGKRPLNISCIGKKDREDILFALDHQFDWLALSFVQNGDDIEEARELCKGHAIRIAAKIERSAAISELDAIIEKADAIMVARGDLGVENGIETIPALQKDIVLRCRHKGVPCIIATQMLETMIHEPVPTRAEVNDVATAVFDQADAVMLSAETAAGHYPVETVIIMSRIIRDAEKFVQHTITTKEKTADNSVAIAAAACQLAEVSSANAVVTYTSSGSTTMKVAAERPATSIICLVPYREVARQLALVWGVKVVVGTKVNGADELVEAAIIRTRRLFSCPQNIWIVVTAGIPSGTPGGTNMIRLVEIKESTLKQ